MDEVAGIPRNYRFHRIRVEGCGVSMTSSSGALLYGGAHQGSRADGARGKNSTGCSPPRRSNVKRLFFLLLLATIVAGCGAYEQPDDLPPRPNPYDETQREAYAEWVELRDQRNEQQDNAPLWVKLPGAVILYYFVLLPVTGPFTVLIVWLLIHRSRRRRREL